jgi:hypothetical protein
MRKRQNRLIVGESMSCSPKIRSDEHCKHCGKQLDEYYHDAGDHFGAGTSPFSEWRLKKCECRKED